jgi:hypothetical protein
MEPQIKYYPIQRQEMFFSLNYCVPCEKVEESKRRIRLLDDAKTQISVSSKFIEETCASLNKDIDSIPKDKDLSNILETFTVAKGITHLKAWDKRFKTIVTNSLNLQKKIVETEKETKPTEEKCSELFSELVKLSQEIKKLEADLSATLDHQKQHRMIVISFKPQEEPMPQINPEMGERNTYVEDSLKGLGMTIAMINVVSTNVFLGCIRGLQAKSRLNTESKE